MILPFLILGYFTLWGGTLRGTYEFYLLISCQLLAFLTLFPWAIKKVQRSESLPKTPLDAPLLLFLSVNAAASLLSVEPRLSLENLLYLSLCVLFYYYLIDLFLSGWKEIDLLGSLLLVSCAVLLLTLAELLLSYKPYLDLLRQQWTTGIEVLPSPGFRRLTSVLGSSFALASYLALLTPLVICLATRSSAFTWGAAIWLFVVALIFPFTGARGGFVALVGALVTLLLVPGLLRAVDNAKRFQGSKFGRLVFIGGGSVFISVILGLGLVTLAYLATLRPGTVEVRFGLWRIATHLFLQRPLFGSGPGTFGLLANEMVATGGWEQMPGFNHAHNAFFNLAAEAGLGGLLTGLWLLLALLRAGWRGWKNEEENGRFLRLGALAGVAGFMVGNLFDVAWAIPALTLHIVIFAALLVKPFSSPRKVKKRASLPLLALLLLIALLFLRWDVAHFYHRLGWEALQRDDLPLAERYTQRAEAIDPFLAYTYQRALVSAGLAPEESDKLERAIDSYQEIIRKGGALPANYANLAWLERLAGDEVKSIAYLKRAAVLYPKNFYYYWGLGLLFEEAGLRDEALAGYAQAASLWPGLLKSGFWQLPERVIAKEEVAREAADLLQGEEFSLAELAYHVGDFALALAILERQGENPQNHTLRGTIEAAQGNEEAALREFQRALQLDPAWARAYLERGKLLLTKGQEKEAILDLLTASYLGDRRAHLYLGESAYRRGGLEEAKGEYEAGIDLCSLFGASPLLAFTSLVYHREVAQQDLSTEEIMCPPQDDLLSIYLHLADAYRRTGEEEKGQEICDWLSRFYRTSFFNETDDYPKACP